MTNFTSQEMLTMSAPAILIVWTLREVFSFLLKSQTQKRERDNDYSAEMQGVLKSLSLNVDKQTSILQEIYLELRENSIRIKTLAENINEVQKH